MVSPIAVVSRLSVRDIKALILLATILASPPLAHGDPTVRTIGLSRQNTTSRRAGVNVAEFKRFVARGNQFG